MGAAATGGLHEHTGRSWRRSTCPWLGAGRVQQQAAQRIETLVVLHPQPLAIPFKVLEPMEAELSSLCICEAQAPHGVWQGLGHMLRVAQPQGTSTGQEQT